MIKFIAQGAMLLIVAALPSCGTVPSTKIEAPQTNAKTIAVFDIDGTLTPANSEPWIVRPSASERVREIAQKGYHIVYLTARRPSMQKSIPSWLEKHGFPQGDLQLAPTEEANKNPEPYKLGVLNDYKRKGWKLGVAFGDSPTDFTAYAKAGIEKARIYALQRARRVSCEIGTYAKCLTGWDQLSVPELPSP